MKGVVITMNKKNTKTKEIYKEVFAHRGFHLDYPENTLGAYKKALKQKLSIEVDIRFLSCNTIVCFHDRYMKRILDIPGKLSRKTYDEIKDYQVLKSNFNVPTLNQVLELINGKVSILLEVKSMPTIKQINILKLLLENYNGKIYLHARNLITYLRLKKIFKNYEVYLVTNIFRKRFEFVKGSHYRYIHQVPTIDDIIVEAEDTSKTVINKIFYAFNKYTSRVKPDHFLLSHNDKKYQIQHRAIVNKDFGEYSKENILECIRLNKVIEVDVCLYNNKIICYHDDKMTKTFGQPPSISEKNKIESAISFEDFLKLVNGQVPILVDIKDFKIFSRNFTKRLMKILESYQGEYATATFNPLVNMFLQKYYPDIIRCQIGHSLNGLKKVRKIMLIITNFFLFYLPKPDIIIYDLDDAAFALYKFNKITGLPVIAYAATNYDDINKYKWFFDNIIVEGNF
jgi:glycerophosphoryl diester phosphodiesterase